LEHATRLFHAGNKEATMSKTDGYERREFLQDATAAVLAAGCWGWQAGAASAEDGAHVHAMLIVGEQTVFLSHLPLFDSPHDYQVILEATFSKPGSNPQSVYFNDRKRTGEKVYTLQPKAFVLPRLAAGQPLRSFSANVFRGQYELMKPREQDAARIGQDVEVKVTKVIHFRKFDPAAAKVAQLEYLLFGKGAELFLAHLITRPPDFDQILPVKVSDHKFTDAELGQGVPIAFPDKTNSVSGRIRDMQPVIGQIKGAGGGSPKGLQLHPGIELYSEEDDLKKRG
jgi:hypothetical protein